jgi:hypothetical protein
MRRGYGVPMDEAPLLSSVLPEFAAQLEAALAGYHPKLQGQVCDLRIGSVCGCDDAGCATFDVPGRQPKDYWVSTEIEELSGLVIVDMTRRHRRILGVEALDRPDLREQLHGHPEIERLIRRPS